MNISGVFTALITPFNPDLSVNYEGLKDNIEFQIKSGVKGILPLGTTGETPTLTEKEKEDIIKLAVQEGKGKVTVMVGTGSNSTKHTIENTQKAKELGADIALVVTPYYNKPTQSGIIKHFQAVTEEVDIPVLVYNIKGRTGTNIETDTMKELSEIPNIIGVKEASGDINQMGQVIMQIQNEKDSFSVVSGDDALTLPLMSLGGRGVVSVVSNLRPKEIVSMVDAGLKGDFVTAREIHYQMLPLFKAAFIETNPMPVKQAMEMCGMAAGPCRLPLCEMQTENVKKLRQVLNDLNFIK